MMPLTRYAGSTVGILGMARSGIAAARALAAAGADVLTFDDRPEALTGTPWRTFPRLPSSSSAPASR